MFLCSLGQWPYSLKRIPVLLEDNESWNISLNTAVDGEWLKDGSTDLWSVKYQNYQGINIQVYRHTTSLITV